MAVPLILDTDIGGDIDDALALAFCVRHPDIDLRAVTTVADDTTRRGWWARKLLHVAGRDDIEVAAGVGWDEPPAGRPSAWPHDGHGLLAPDETFELSPRDGVTLLLETPDVTISTIGMQSNIAAALDRDPSFVQRVPLLAVMGGVFAPVVVGAGRTLPPAIDHNLCVDPAASVKALNAGFRTLYTPIDVTVHARLREHHLDALRDGDDLCRTIANAIDAWRRTSHMPADTVAVMHDPLTVACLVERRFVESRTAPVTVALHRSGHVRTFIDPLEGKDAEIVTSVEGDDFCAFWLETVLG
jgi:inosine-uridine nucleoside N-ribohydrolase